MNPKRKPPRRVVRRPSRKQPTTPKELNQDPKREEFGEEDPAPASLDDVADDEPEIPDVDPRTEDAERLARMASPVPATPSVEQQVGPEPDPIEEAPAEPEPEDVAKVPGLQILKEVMQTTRKEDGKSPFKAFAVKLRDKHGMLVERDPESGALVFSNHQDFAWPYDSVAKNQDFVGKLVQMNVVFLGTTSAQTEVVPEDPPAEANPEPEPQEPEPVIADTEPQSLPETAPEPKIQAEPEPKLEPEPEHKSSHEIRKLHPFFLTYEEYGEDVYPKAALRWTLLKDRDREEFHWSPADRFLRPDFEFHDIRTRIYLEYIRRKSSGWAAWRATWLGFICVGIMFGIASFIVALKSGAL